MPLVEIIGSYQATAIKLLLHKELRVTRQPFDLRE